MNIDNNQEIIIKTSSQDAQHSDGYELSTPTLLLTNQQEPITMTTAKITKKKLRNRKLQRYRRKLRKQGLDEATIRMYKNAYQLQQLQQQQQQDQTQDVDIEEINHLDDVMETNNELVHQQILPGPYNPQRKTDKRKRDESTKRKKKQRSSSKIEQQQQQQEEQENQEQHIIQSNINKQRTTTSIHYYLNATDKKFKQMLKAAFVDAKDILQWCKLEENFRYLREHTRLLDRVYYLKLEEDLWENYIKYGETYHCWTSPPPLSKTIIQQNQLTFDYQRQSQKSMEKYRRKIQEQLQEAEKQLEKHTLLLKDLTITIDEQRLWAAILALVRKGQHKLSQNYEHQKRLFKNCAKDYHLVKACYNCQPTEEEILLMQIIWQATINECKSQENVDILKQHLYVKRIPKSLDYLDQSFSNVEQKLTNPIYNNNIRTIISSRHKKIIAQNKCDLITLHISIAEAAVRGYRQYSEDKKLELINRIKQNPLRQSSTTTQIEEFIQAIEERQKHIRQYMQYLTKRRIRFFYHRSDDRRQKWHRRGYRLNLYWDILPSSPIIEVCCSKLTCEQLALLARGPKYVPPCQSRFYQKTEKRQKLIEQEYQTIMKTITEFFRQRTYSISDKRINEFSIDLKKLLQRLYTKKLSRKLYVRAKREHKLVIHIRRYLRQHPQIILRRTDKSKVFHLGDANDYRVKVLEYMQETEAYEEITSGISPLAANLPQVVSLLNRLHYTQKPLITKKQYDAMYSKQDEIELGHLYFIPKPHKIGTPLRPIVASIHAPAILISKFLDDRLRPIFNHIARKTIYISSTNLVKQIENYTKQGHLLSTTKFITIDVKNLYTMIPRGGALDALYRFCMKYGKEGKISNLTVNTIIQLACVVLETNCFAFDNKYYKQIRGGAMGSPFTMTLANIYMYEWEQSLIQHQQERNELYGRYIDDIFMTSNESIN